MDLYKFIEKIDPSEFNVMHETEFKRTDVEYFSCSSYFSPPIITYTYKINGKQIK